MRQPEHAARRAILLASDRPAPGRAVKPAFGVARDRLAPSLDCAVAHLDLAPARTTGSTSTMTSCSQGGATLGKIRLWLAAVSCGALSIALTGCSTDGPTESGAARTTTDILSQWRGCTEQVTLATLTGQMNACVTYSYVHGRLRVAATAASYKATNGYDLPYFSFVFHEPSSAVVDYRHTSPVFDYENVFSHNTGVIHLARNASIHAGDVLQVSLWATEASSGQVTQMASVTLTLYPQGLACPDLGASAGTNEGTGQC
jgi:hypothetical protein